MKITSTRFGEMEIDEKYILTFTEGLLGFPDNRKYVILDHGKDSPFKWMQSLENPALAFVLIDPLYFMPDYSLNVKGEDIRDLHLTSFKEAVVACMVTITGGCKEITANLLGPLVINPKKMLSKQIVLTNSPYSVKHPIIPQAGIIRSSLEKMKALRQEPLIDP